MIRIVADQASQTGRLGNRSVFFARGRSDGDRIQISFTRLINEPPLQAVGAYFDPDSNSSEISKRIAAQSLGQFN
jgi:hypothetical protein